MNIHFDPFAPLSPVGGAPVRSLPTKLTNGPFTVATRGLAKRYGREAALAGVDLQVPAGAVYVLVGPNGAGKSTLLRTLMNLVRHDGSVEVFGLDPSKHPAQVRAQIGYVPERHDPGYGWMRIARLFRHYAAYYPAWDERYAERLCKTLDIRTDRRVSGLSKGQARAVQLVLAMAHKPPLLLLDEPTDGFDPVVRDGVLALLAEHIADTQCTTLVSTHLVYEVERLADTIGVLQKGRLVLQATRNDLHRMLRQYRAEVADDWLPPALPGVVLQQTKSGREIRWTVWGEQGDVAAALSRSGAGVHDVAPMSLDDAAITLLRNKELS